MLLVGVNEYLKNNEIEKASEKIKELEEKINKSHTKLAYYIEHDELEKVETNFTEGKSLVKTGNYDVAQGDFEKMIFVLDHIADKYSFSLENIF